MKRMSRLLGLLLGILTGIVYTVFWAGPLPSYAIGLPYPEDTVLASVMVAESPRFDSDATVSSQTLDEQVEKARQEAEGTAESRLDQEAIAAVEATKTAIDAIDAGKPQEAIQALEQATGKLDILLARNPKLALVPVGTTVTIVDVAPLDNQSIQQFRKRLTSAINAGDFPEAREILTNLMSEVQTKTLNLPLVTYPEAMKEAARLLDLDDPAPAKEVLQTALSTLVITEQTQPIPVINAQTHLIGARAVVDTDRAAARRLLEAVRRDLRWAKDLGYASSDRTYREIDQAISKVENQLNLKTDNTVAAFDQLQDQLSNFLERLSA